MFAEGHGDWALHPHLPLPAWKTLGAPDAEAVAQGCQGLAKVTHGPPTLRKAKSEAPGGTELAQTKCPAGPAPCWAPGGTRGQGPARPSGARWSSRCLAWRHWRPQRWIPGSGFCLPPPFSWDTEKTI